MIKGNKYKLKFRDEVIIYLGYNWGVNGYRHQFAIVDNPTMIWFELSTSDLWIIDPFIGY